MEGFDINSYAYTFTGKQKVHIHKHSSKWISAIEDIRVNNYDNAERIILKGSFFRYGDVLTRPLSVKYAYDESGRLKKKTISDAVGESVYDYNIRNWLTAINSKHFNQKLNYNESINGSIPSFNGNISSMTWNTTDSSAKRNYSFDYDGLNRLTGSFYSEAANRDNTATSIFEGHPNYTETIDEYDKQGNIKRLTRFGVSKKVNGNITTSYDFDVIDKLTLNYSGNQLQNIADAAIDPLYQGAFNFVDGNKTNEVEYTYDANGNLTQDKNKGITKIQYNKLNLPDKLQFAYGHTTEYLYDAAGVKHNVKQTTVKDNLLVPMGSTVAVPTDKVAITNQTDYCGNMIYEDGNLKMILTDEGYVDMSTGYPEYYYYVKDHQGNNRVVENQAGLVLQSNHYYPFGMTFGEGITSSNQRYKYNGKELDRMHGLDLYDYGARMQDGMNFTTMDPLAEKYYSISPYAYCKDSPINAIDSDGRLVLFINGMHRGDGGKPEYWGGFDTKVMNRVKDWNAEYIDGSHGGMKSMPWNAFADERKDVGYQRGKDYAKSFLFRYQNDDGSFKESIKVITHSMGAAYAKGFIKGLIDAGVPIDLIEFEADFAPFQPTKQEAVKGVDTHQFSHSKDWIAGNQRMKGAKYENTSIDSGQSHTITDFTNQIRNLPEGKYKFEDGKIVPY